MKTATWYAGPGPTDQSVILGTSINVNFTVGSLPSKTSKPFFVFLKAKTSSWLHLIGAVSGSKPSLGGTRIRATGLEHKKKKTI